MTMTILHQVASRHLGRKDGLSGRLPKCPANTDWRSYTAGFIEGRAARLRGFAGGIGLNDNRFPNVVKPGSPRKRPIIVDDDDER
jgi:hypothetical protein